jgi:hypothetical protein
MAWVANHAARLHRLRTSAAFEQRASYSLQTSDQILRYMLLTIFALVMIVFAKEPPDLEHQTLREHLSCMFQADGWYFNLIYIITFGGFLGLATFLPSFYFSQFHVSKVQAGTLTVFATLTGSLTRVLGGWFDDRFAPGPAQPAEPSHPRTPPQSSRPLLIPISQRIDFPSTLAMAARLISSQAAAGLTPAASQLSQLPHGDSY